MHPRKDLEYLALGAALGTIPDYQLAAWLMAAYLRPLSEDETVDLTLAMAGSGGRVDLSGLPKPWVDKHSTGGVGDKTSIVLLPLLALCGLTIVKMSGAGLGITGGTIDKLGSIPGFRLDLSIAELKEQARKIGVALTGQTPELAPADKALYALRDATATVRSLPLIVSSILSKKIAGGAETVVLDVKCGSGAFMRNLEEAGELAASLAQVGRRCGLNVKIAVTDMDQPLGSAIGNALEVLEALQVLSGIGGSLSGPSRRFRELCLSLSGEVLAASGLCPDEEEGRRRAESALHSGEAAAKAEQWIAAQGGPVTLKHTVASLPTAPVRKLFTADRAGWIKRLDAAEVGAVVVDLGGGRHQKGDAIDPSVGVVVHAGVGDQVRSGQPLFEIHARSDAEGTAAVEGVRAAFRFSSEPVQPGPLILRRL